MLSTLYGRYEHHAEYVKEEMNFVIQKEHFFHLVHAIRRAYAKNLHEKGASIALISKALGHSDLAVTTQYLELGIEEVAKDLREFL